MNVEKIHTWKEQIVAYFEDICMDRLKKIIVYKMSSLRQESIREPPESDFSDWITRFFAVLSAEQNSELHGKYTVTY